MRQARIVKRTMPDGKENFTIQQKHFLLFWWWVDAWVNDPNCTDTFPTLEEATEKFVWFNGTKIIEEIIVV